MVGVVSRSIDSKGMPESTPSAFPPSAMAAVGKTGLNGTRRGGRSAGEKLAWEDDAEGNAWCGFRGVELGDGLKRGETAGGDGGVERGELPAGESRLGDGKSVRGDVPDGERSPFGGVLMIGESTGEGAIRIVGSSSGGFSLDGEACRLEEADEFKSISSSSAGR